MTEVILTSVVSVLGRGTGQRQLKVPPTVNAGERTMSGRLHTLELFSSNDLGLEHPSPESFHEAGPQSC